MIKKITEIKKRQDADSKQIDDEMRKIVISRLSVLSSNTVISLGSSGSFSRDELVESIERGDEVGDKIVEMQMEWLRSFKKEIKEIDVVCV